MAFRDWLSPKAAIVEEKAPLISPTIAIIATIAEVESSKLAANDHYENIVVSENDQDHHTKSVVEAQEEADWHEFLYGKSTEELLYNHLLTCPLCHVEAEQYCLYGAELGKAYDALLLRQGDAQTRRESLALQVDRACISGRSVFVSLDHDNLPTPQQKPVKPLTYGIGDSERPFVNHVMACKQCRPRSALYCGDGLKLKANA